MARDISWQADTGTTTLVAIVVSHNRLEQLKATVARLLEEPVDRVVVVDNRSEDGTRDWLQAQSEPRVTSVLNDENLGGAGGFEVGLRHACERFDADWYVVMDDDARPSAGAIARFRDLVSGPPRDEARVFDAVAAGVFYPDGEICEMNRPSRNPFWHWRSFVSTLFGGGRAGFHVGDPEYGARALQPIDSASFVGLFLSRNALRLGGFPRGELFIYGDDVLYTLNLRRAGGRIGFAPWVAFEHDCSTLHRSERHRNQRRVHRPLWKIYYNYRNGLLAYRLAAGRLMFWPVLVVVIPKWLAMAHRYDGQERRIFLRLLGIAIHDALLGKMDRKRSAILGIAAVDGREGVATAKPL
jgi:GT2 family glycosyltransferase